jgi:hypothetical protein
MLALARVGFRAISFDRRASGYPRPADLSAASPRCIEIMDAFAGNSARGTGGNPAVQLALKEPGRYTHSSCSGRGPAAARRRGEGNETPLNSA